MTEKKAMQTEAYLPFHSTQEWTIDPDFMVVTIDEKLIRLVEQGLELLKESPFNAITSPHSPNWDLVILSDNDDGYEPFDPEYTLDAPDIKISFQLDFEFNFIHTSDRARCSMFFPELETYWVKAWVESYGYIFVQLPDGEDRTPGRWLCVDAADDEDGFAIGFDTLAECVEKAADWLESTISDSDLLRPKLDLRIPGLTVPL